MTHILLTFFFTLLDKYLLQYTTILAFQFNQFMCALFTLQNGSIKNYQHHYRQNLSRLLKSVVEIQLVELRRQTTPVSPAALKQCN